jgi:ABC-type sugar transport system ATPase subunit
VDNGRQWLSVALLVGVPVFVIMDEPTAALGVRELQKLKI